MNETRKSERREFLRSATSLAAAAAVWPLAGPAKAASQKFADLSATQAVASMRAGEIKSEDYARALLDRCDDLKELNAFISLDREQVLESARNADKARAAGKKLGALHGLPVPMKDSINTRTLPTTSGTPALRNFRPKADATVAKAFFDSGAILMGKTNLHELSFGWTTNNLAFGSSRNPYDKTRVPGGSSGGTAVAVATAMAPLGLAEDTCGSIRVPASLCGIKGFRPSTFRWPVSGVMPLTSIFDTVGPHARSVADLILADAVVTQDARIYSPLPLKGIRLGIIRDHFYADLDPEVERVTERALSRLRDAGVEIVEGEIPELKALWQAATFPVFQHETQPAIEQYLREFNTGITWDELLANASDDIKQAFGLFVVEGGKFRAPLSVYEEARKVHRPKLQNAFRLYFREHRIDAIVHPALMTSAPLIGEDSELEIAGKKVPFYVAMSRNIAPGSTTGIPGLILPGGMTRGGLPVGLEFDAPVGKDRELLALGLTLERVLGSVPAPLV